MTSSRGLLDNRRTFVFSVSREKYILLFFTGWKVISHIFLFVPRILEELKKLVYKMR